MLKGRPLMNIFDLKAQDLGYRQIARSTGHVNRGAYRGRKRSLTTERIVELQKRAENGESKVMLSLEFGISRDTVYRYLNSRSQA